MSKHKFQGLIEMFWTVFYAVIIALGVRTIAYEPFNIPSGSMKSTLLVGDYVFVSKFSYGYSQYSLPFGLPLIPGRILFTEPERGDVAVFKLPTDNKTDYIKRIIGLPGDRIQMIKGVLNINGTPVKRERIGDFIEQNALGNLRRTVRYIETLPNGRSHEILEQTDNAMHDNTGVYTVPPGHYFMMGDNRDNSQDSRVLERVGFVPKVNLVGRADFLFFSVAGSAREFWRWPWTVRFERIFKGIT